VGRLGLEQSRMKLLSSEFRFGTECCLAQEFAGERFWEKD